MRHFLLAKADAGIPKADILAVILVRMVEVVAPLHVPSLALAEEESIRKMIHVAFESILRDRVFAAEPLLAVRLIRNIPRIGQRSDGRAQQIQDRVQYIRAFRLNYATGICEKSRTHAECSMSYSLSSSHNLSLSIIS